MMATMFSYVPHVSVYPISFCKVALFPPKHTISGYYWLSWRLQTLHNTGICSANFLEIWLILKFKIVSRQQLAFFSNLHFKPVRKKSLVNFMYRCSKILFGLMKRVNQLKLFKQKKLKVTRSSKRNQFIRARSH